FPATIRIDRVVWQRDREQQFSDRLATEYQIEVAAISNDWKLVASSRDRVPYVADRPPATDYSSAGLPANQVRELEQLVGKRSSLEAHVKDLANVPIAYSGKLVDSPGATYRLQRGDAMQMREPIEPRGLTAIPVAFRPDEAARLAGDFAGNVAPTNGL